MPAKLVYLQVRYIASVFETLHYPWFPSFSVKWHTSLGLRRTYANCLSLRFRTGSRDTENSTLTVADLARLLTDELEERPCGSLPGPSGQIEGQQEEDIF